MAAIDNGGYSMAKSYNILPANAKCSRCRGRAEIALPSHHARFCPDCFDTFFQNAVARALKKLKLPQDRELMVAVSGGKDSLATWDILHRLGYPTKGLHLNLGIDQFSGPSREAVERFAQPRGLPWSEYSLQEEFGFSLPEVQTRFRRKICSVCGRLKRQLFNKLTVKEGFDILVTGHNLDDEAGRLLGNLVGNRQEFVHKQHPFLPSPHPLIPAKLKPLYRVEIKEILIYCELRGIEPAEASCHFSKGATSHSFKDALDLLEQRMPGTKRSFLFSYLEGKTPPHSEGDFGTCAHCGQPAWYDICGLCSLKRQIQDSRDRKEAAP